MAVENQTLKVTTAATALAALIGAALAFYGWAEDQHEKSEELARAAATLATETKQQNELLRQIVVQQQETLTKAADNAQANREALIRIEARMDRDSE